MASKLKRVKLDQGKIDRARRLLRTKTDQDTLDRALDVVLAERPILSAHQRVKATGGFRDAFGHP